MANPILGLLVTIAAKAIQNSNPATTISINRDMSIDRQSTPTPGLNKKTMPEP
jgi:hypothetical protein